MDLKKLFNNNKAVSPVIGVVLMVAITVILAAAIGSSVFGQGPAKTAPQANINAKFLNGTAVSMEHLGGDTIVWDNTQIRFTYENGTALPTTANLGANGTVTLTSGNTQFSVGDIESFTVASSNLPSGGVYTLKITDKVSNQLICDKKLRT
jgi:flagellin-like protein